MKTEDLYQFLLTHSFQRTSQPLTHPLVVHGVPGSGKSHLIKTLIKDPTVQAYTAGAPYGHDLTQAGVLPISRYQPDRSRSLIILDEYQIAPLETITNYTTLFGDPYQGPTRLPAHYIKTTSHRVPRPICDFLRAREFDIQGHADGSIITSHPYSKELKPDALNGTVLHLGQISKTLTHRHNICSLDVHEVQGLEFDNVVVVYHSTEKANRSDLYIACTRSRRQLTLISDEFHEFRTAS